MKVNMLKIILKLQFVSITKHHIHYLPLISGPLQNYPLVQLQ